MFKQYPDIILLDSAYKTNEFNMPLLNICGITSSNTFFRLGLHFCQEKGNLTTIRLCSAFEKS